MKKQNIFITIGLVLVLGVVGFVYYSSTKTQNIADTNPPVVQTEPEKVAETNPPAIAPEQSGVIDEHLTINNELRDVNFCGKTYKVKQVLIDGVDVVQRVAELANNPDLMPSTFEKGVLVTKEAMAEVICENVRANSPNGNIKISEIIKNKSGEGYSLGFSSLRFGIDILTKNIFNSDGYGGETIGPIGRLK